ncbi:helix-turn-helix transcriptional regulator [Roseomonas sp. BN140053]|uniref:helix-turn-helix transcriptional regulator n=1 Tax=Roseomonas sp. BN140053 TaxID=3391898 RepID=UPI0039ECD062
MRPATLAGGDLPVASPSGRVAPGPGFPVPPSPGLAGAVLALGESGFAARFLDALDAVAPADMFSAFALEGPGVLRLLCAGGGQGCAPDFPRTASQHYAGGYWRHDPAMAAAVVAGGPAAAPLLRHQRRERIPRSHYRTLCYEEPRVLDRLSVLAPAGEGRPILFSLYRTQEAGCFSAADAARLSAAGAVLAALLGKHDALRRFAQPPRMAAALATRLQRACPELSPREAAVCGGLAAGQALKEIAREAGLGLSSIVTYRKRAYAKLGVGDRRGLLRRIEEAPD